jgi:cell shape-determining protein MreC
LYLSGGVVSGLRSAANLVVAPFSWTVDVIARPIGHMLAGAVNYSDVVAQNQRLRYQLGQAQLKSNEGWALERQLQEMTTQLHVPFVGSLSTVGAQVTSLSPTNFAATFDITEGRNGTCRDAGRCQWRTDRHRYRNDALRRDRALDH